MLARTPGWLMATRHERLITDEMAYAASLRHWGKHEAQRLAICVTWGIYPEDEAQRELATHLAWHAQRAKMLTVSCRALAASMLADELETIEAHHDKVLAEMTSAAEQVLRGNPRARLEAANAAADIAEANGVPPALIDTAFRFALWRTRRRA